MRYEFGGYTLDTDRRELLGSQGAIPLRPKVFAILVYLIAHRDRVVLKQEVFDQLWAGVHVGDATLNSCVKAARRAIGDSGQRQGMIRTWHGVGYRFVAPVEERSEAETTAARSSLAPGASPREQVTESASAGASEDSTRAGLPTGKERKQVSVLHCVVHEASRLASRLGPEAMHETMERFMAVAHAAVQGYGGTVTQWLGDGFVALFGAPRAYEDSARRAVAAALDLRRELAGVAGQGDEPLSVRIGLHTGSVIVSTAAGRLYAAVGETSETARALQQAAPRNAILASAAAREVIADEVSAEPFTSGESEAWSGYLIHAFATRRAGVPWRSARVLSRFVGRDRELAILLDRLAQLAQGAGQIVAIVGDPGIGKSRLVDEFRRSAPAQGTRFFQFQCLAYASASPYMPGAGLLRQLAGLQRSDPPQHAQAKLRTLLENAGAAAPGALALMSQLLELPGDERVLERLSPDERRAQTFATMHRLVASAARPDPLVLVVEDLQWIDPTSEAWLSELVARLAGLPVFLLLTHRPGYLAPWRQQSFATQLALRPLSVEESAVLVRSTQRAAVLSDAALARVVGRAQGNPFFLEELTAALAMGRLPAPEIPETVQAVLAARIDQLAPADKRLLQIAAVIGAVVPLELLGRVDDASAPDRDRSLARLQEADLIYERPSEGDRAVAFKHALTQEVAYWSLVRHTRGPIHARIAHALETHFAPLVREHPERLAHHLTEAGATEQAIAHWQAAGRRAAERSADLEAVRHFERALSLMPAGESASAARRLAVLLDLGVSLQVVKGAGSPETGRIYGEARELCPGVASERQEFEVLFGVWRHQVLWCEFAAAQAIANDLNRIGRASRDAELMLQGCHAAWTTARFLGEWGATRAYAERGIALAEQGAGSGPFYRFAGHHPVVCARGALARALQAQGHAGRAWEEAARTIAHADALDHAATTADAVLTLLDLHLVARDPDAVDAAAVRLGALAAERCLAMFQAIAGFARAWCRAQAGDGAEGVRGMRDALRVMRDTGPNAREPYYLALLGEALGAQGAFEEARVAFDEALGRIARGVKRHWAEPEVYRLLAEASPSVAGSREPETEAHLVQAIAVAREQGATLLELRAAMSLCRRVRDSERRAEAARTLAAALSRADAAADAPEFAEARSLLHGTGG